MRMVLPLRLLPLLLIVSAHSRADGLTGLDSVMRTHTQRGMFSGVVRIERNHRLFFERAYGMASDELGVRSDVTLRYKLHSASKPMLAVAVMRAAQVGRIQLDASICSYLAPCPSSWATVTPRHLLAHTSGIPDFANDIVKDWRGDTARTLAELAPKLQALELQSAPGKVWSYSNAGYVLLSRILEVRYDQPIHRVMRELIFLPAHMSDTTLEQPPAFGEMDVYAGKLPAYDGQLIEPRAVPGYNGSPQALQAAYSKMYMIPGAGGVTSTASDVARFIEAVFTGELLGEGTRTEMITVPDIAVRPDVAGIQAYALGWSVGDLNGHPFYSHSGGNNGFVTFFAYFPKERVSIVLLSNRGFTRYRDILPAIHAAVPELTDPAAAH